MPQANVLRVGLLTSGALAIRFIWLVSKGVSTARRVRWVQENHLGELVGWPVTLLGPEGTGTRIRFWCSLSSSRFGLLLAWLVGGVRACGPVRPPYRIVVLLAGM
jgi:hypothetical protein